MKKIFLTLMCVVISTLSFSQKNLDKANLKTSSVKAVDYMNKTLKLNEKQKAIFMSAYAEYAANMMKAVDKTKQGKKAADPKVADPKKNRKQLNMHMLRFTEKRDSRIKECLKKKQVVQYDNLVRDINPYTLEVRQRKK